MDAAYSSGFVLEDTTQGLSVASQSEKASAYTAREHMFDLWQVHNDKAF